MKLEDLPKPKNGFINIHHPDLQDSHTQCAQAAYEEVWLEKGWVVTEESSSEETESGGDPEVDPASVQTEVPEED